MVYQREPHSQQIAFRSVDQPAHIGERLALARRTCDEESLDPTRMWVDGMDDQSRALFGDLPSPAIVIDPFGTIRSKLPWAEPERIEPLLTDLLAGLPDEVEARLTNENPADVRAARLYRARLTGDLPAAEERQPMALWAAAIGAEPLDSTFSLSDSWLGLTAAATLLQTGADGPWRQRCVDHLVAHGPIESRHWALQLSAAELERSGDTKLAEQTKRRLEELRREHPWLTESPRER